MPDSKERSVKARRENKAHWSKETPSLDGEKRCSNCKDFLPKVEFSFYKGAKDGFSANCRSCAYLVYRAYVEEHPARIRKTRQTNRERWNKETPSIDGEKKCANCTDFLPKVEFSFHKTNKDGFSDICKSCKYLSKRAYVEEHPEKVNAGKKSWVDRNQERNTENHKRWNEDNKDARNSYTHTHRALLNGNGGFWTAAEWDALKSFYEHTCLGCNKQEPEIKLSVDHIIPLIKGGRNDIHNIQPLCTPCNSKKHTKVIDYRFAFTI